MSVERW